MKLYHYVNCPFCVRVRMALGLLNISYESVVVPYDDEKTPMQLTGKKMLPIFEFSKNEIINESLDIIKKLDTKSTLNFAHYQLHQTEIDQYLSKIGSDVHSLCMPYWIYTPEFNEASRNYFQQKKEIKRGPFKELVKNRNEFINSLNKTLAELEINLTPFYKSNQLTIVDIMIASHLWGLFILPEFQFDQRMYQYLMSIKKQTHFDYHHDYWK